MGSPLVGSVPLTLLFKQPTAEFLIGKRKGKVRVQGYGRNRPSASIKVSRRVVSDTSNSVSAASLETLKEHSSSKNSERLMRTPSSSAVGKSARGTES